MTRNQCPITIFLVTGNIEFWKIFFSREEFLSVEKKVIYLHSSRISFDRKYTDGCWLVYYSGKNFFFLGKIIDFCQELILSSLRRFLSILFLFCFWYYMFLSNMNDFLSLCSFKSKMQRKCVIFVSIFQFNFLNILVSSAASLLY